MRFSKRFRVGPPVNDKYMSYRITSAREMYSVSPRSSLAKVTGVSMS